MTPLALDLLTARRFMRRALLLDRPAPDIGTALAHHGYIQIDPINVTGRMHDLILRNRVDGYRRWETHLKLRQRRLVLLKRQELALVEDLVQPIHVEGCPPLHCLASDLPLLSAIENLESKIENSQRAALLLAPLDPLIYDRRVTAGLWGFNYTWEVYTPPAKRKRGYYALPVLAGTELVGHIDPKAERDRNKLRIVSRAVRRGHKVVDAVRTLAAWLGLK